MLRPDFFFEGESCAAAARLMVAKALERTPNEDATVLQNVLEADRLARETVLSFYREGHR